MIGMFSASTLAQERSTTVEIGTAEESTFRLPCTPGNWYSISEQIYTADEINAAGGGPGTITSISFYGYNSWTTSPGERTWDIYLVNTNKSTFSSASDWVGVNANQKVFSGTISIIKNTWTTVPISTFTYEGGNLLVVVDDNSGSSTQSSGHGGYVFNTASHQSNWAASSDDINPSNPNMTCTAWETKKNNIRFEFDLTPVSCPAPQNLVVSAVSSNSATLTWQAGGDETAWNVQYKTASSGSWSQSVSVSSPIYTILNLTTNTDYQARVQAACSGEESGWRTVSFATECEAIDLPYYYNFSDATVSSTGSMPDCWHRINDATNSSYQGYPRVNADYHHNTSSPTRSLLFNYSSYIPNQIAILPVINVNDYSLNQYQVVFWVRSASNKKLQVGTMTDPNNASTFRQIGEVTTSGSSTSWQEYTVRLDNNTYTEQEKYIAIKSPTTNASSAIYLDDIDVQLIPSCEKPYSLTKSDEYAHGATIAWAGGNDNWQIAYSTTSNFDPDDSNQCTYLDAPSNPYTITGLAPQTTYYIRVRSNCGDNNYSYWNTTPTNFNFTTTIACPAPTDLHCTSITNNSAALAWTKSDESQNDFTVAYSTTSEFDPETATQCQSNTNSLILTGLTEETTYYAKVRANCGGDDGSSNWSNQCSFKPSSGGELEVNQGTNTNSYVPVYGNQVQNTTQSQFIIPSTTLSDIAGCVISKITFHYSNNLATINWGEAEFEVYVKEVDETVFANNATFNWDGLIKVYTGKLSPSNRTMEIEFDNPYEYCGGNLKIGVKQTKKGSKKSCTWLGINTTYISSLGGYNTFVYRPKFLPWTTITYTTKSDQTNQTNELAEGWNWFSTYIEMDGVNGLDMLKESLNGNGLQIKSRVDGYVEYEDNEWDGTLDGITNEQMYMIQVNAACSVNLKGKTARPGEHPITVNSGWNWIGFPNEQELNIGDALSDFTAEPDDQIKAFNGYAEFDGDEWSGSLETLKPGQGFMLYSNNTETNSLIYHVGRSIGNQPNSGMVNPTCNTPTRAQAPTHWTPVTIGDFNMTCTSILVIDEVEQQNLQLEIGVFDQNNVCRGAILPKIKNSTGKYIYYLTIYGEADYTYTCKVFDHETGQERVLNFVPNQNDPIVFDANHRYGSPSNPYNINFTSASTFTKNITAYTPDSKDHYYLIASPIGTVSPENVTNMLSNNYDLYRFNQSATANDQGITLEWENYKQEGDNYHFNLELGKGYLYSNSGNGSEVPVTLTFTGTPIESTTHNITLVKDNNAEFSGWNLIGNPFAEHAAYIGRPFYVMNENGTEILAQPVSRGIDPMEGVFVIATGNNEPLTFSTTEPTKTSKALILNLSGPSVLRQNQDLWTAIIDRAILSFDEGQQLPKFQLNANSTKVYISKDSQDYAVVCCDNMGEMPVNFKAAQNGSYSINVNTEGTKMAYLHLIDNMTGADVDMLQSTSYSFEARTTDYTSRFKLVFVSNEDDASTSSATFAFNSNGSWVIANDGIATLQVIDLNGRILSSQQIEGCTETHINAAAGIYMIRLVSGNDIKVQKIAIK